MLVMMIISAHSLVLMQSLTVESLTMLMLAVMHYVIGMRILDSGQGFGLFTASHAYAAPQMALILQQMSVRRQHFCFFATSSTVLIGFI